MRLIRLDHPPTLAIYANRISSILQRDRNVGRFPCLRINHFKRGVLRLNTSWPQQTYLLSGSDLHMNSWYHRQPNANATHQEDHSRNLN